MSGLQDSHKFGIFGIALAVVFVAWYCNQKREQMVTIPAARASQIPDMAAVTAGTPSPGGLAPADLDSTDYAPYQAGTTAPCQTMQAYTR